MTGTKKQHSREDGAAEASEENKAVMPENNCREEVSSILTGEFAHPADAADHIENLSIEKQVCMMEHLSTEDAAETLAEMEDRVQTDIIENLDVDVAVRILSEMSPDDATDVLDELDEEHRDVLLGRLEDDDAEEIRSLLAFDPDTAGGIMNTEIIILGQELTADQAIMHIRREMEDKEIPYYAYIVDSADRLVGVLSLRDLLLCRPGTVLEEKLSDQSLISAVFDEDKENVAHLLSRYNFMALPVVDYEGRLLGVVTYDDVIDIIHEEATEDMLGMVGAGQDETVDTPWLESVKVRLPWLFINMLNSSVSAYVVFLFEGSIAQMAILAVLMPIVANQAGNTGQQALAVMIRQLAVERFDRVKSWKAVLREAKVGALTGLIVSLLVMLGVFLFTQNVLLAQVMAAALALDMLLGALAGASIPLILKELGRDPAQASSIFLTTLTDGFGFLIFLGLATLFIL
ncbi:magnesium transporter [Halodesulfovibrio sp.]|jgi:magnesium transporter|uniref:magnesium transporter n=1 Tax=Halodesulfovibrio sp. TaxID=1912772 RepID=UPI0025FD47D2|nr:magnesium transporter [Halodesulfovibrio sp.]MCT4533911.1 magnesium transporter [Halodesulfovibrio sp.]MCT4628143.1 magnesium transporter [Halodesulfovibrio sp.]